MDWKIFLPILENALGARDCSSAGPIWRFKEVLTRAGVLDALHDAFSNQLDELGFQASKGQIVDAGIVPAPRQRNSREENKAIGEGNPPSDWSEAKRRQKDVDARWTKKREQSHFGCKNHIAVDVKHKFVRAWQVTAANVHDRRVFLELLARNTSRGIKPCLNTVGISRLQAGENVKEYGGR